MGSSVGAQGGALLIEVILGMLIFSIGILGLVGLQAVAIKSTAESRYRAEASFLGNQLLSAMWLDQGNLAQYRHYAQSTNCVPAGSPSPLAAQPASALATWLATVSRTLPGATVGQQQITVNADNSVDITLCWRAPQDGSWRRLNLIAYINGSSS